MSGPVTLLHDGDLLDDLLQIGLHRNLLDSHHLARLLVNGFKNTAIGTRHTNNITSPCIHIADRILPFMQQTGREMQRADENCVSR